MSRRVANSVKKCRKVCKKCDAYQLCGGCSPSKKEICLVNRCLSKGVRVMGVTVTCDTCEYAFACPAYMSHPPPKADGFSELDTVLKSWNTVPPTIELPRFIPEVPIEKPLKLRWDELGVKAVIVTFSDPKGGNMKRAKEEGIKGVLSFYGTVLLSTIAPDRLLKEDTFNITLELIKMGGFDGVIGWDMPVYIDAPKITNIINLISATLFTIRFVKQGIATIPLLKGSDPSEMESHSQWLKRLGFKQVALHATEYIILRSKKYSKLKIREIAEDLYGVALLKIRREIMAQPLIIGAMSPRSFPSLLYKERSKPSFAGMSWLLEAREWHVYHGSKVINLKDSVMECGCEACFGKSVNQISRSVESLAEHNLVQFKNFMERKGVSEIQLFDAVLERESMAVVADLHTGTEQSLWRLCIEKLKEIHPSYIVFLGDAFDLINGKPRLYEITKFMDALRDIKAEIIPISGCSDSSDEKLLEAMQRFSFARGPLRPQLLKPNIEISKALRDFLIFHTLAKERIKVKLANGMLVAFSHGHELMFEKETDPKRVAEQLLQRKKDEDIHVVGHYHQSFFEPEKGVIMLGAWQTPTMEDEEAGFIPDLMEILLIREDGKLELIREH